MELVDWMQRYTNKVDSISSPVVLYSINITLYSPVFLDLRYLYLSNHGGKASGGELHAACVHYSRAPFAMCSFFALAIQRYIPLVGDALILLLRPILETLARTPLARGL